ncbi:MAG: autotransporter outer membrane beta-barrel domain-containing protein [Hyphomicrobium sp.]
MAQNATCSTSGAQRTCNDVAGDGIAYTSGVDKVTVNDTVSGSSIVNINTIGIRLSQTGGDGHSDLEGVSPNKFTDTKGTSDTADDVVILIDANSQALRTAANNRIKVVVEGGQEVMRDETTNALVSQAEFSTILSQAGPGAGVVVGDVTVQNAASFTTSNAHGIQASASGGKGGNGGWWTVLGIYTEGEDGGDGSAGGSVSVNNSGQIVTSGTGKYGVAATSQGGAGGKGGGAGGIVANPGGGGDGGSGGQVNVTLTPTSSIITHGDEGHGVFAQSQGGDGGNGGDAGGLGVLGTDGGNGGAGAKVIVSNGGYIETTGEAAYGMYARSFGAGAGQGSSGGGLVAFGGNGGGYASGGDVDVSNNGDIKTSGTGSLGVLAQSIGGGGGDGGNAGGLFTSGGRGGSGGDGGTVTYTQSAGGSVHTTNDRATAILAQSIGGGGGNGGNAITVNPVAAVALGGAGGAGGHGGTVIVDASGTVKTDGDDANAIAAQSIGGGGGNGGLAVAVTATTLPYSASVGIGGTGGSGGRGGAVNLTSNAQVHTTGDRSSAVVAQSIGGGGGNGGLAVAASVGPSISANVSIGGGGGSGGSGGAVEVETSTGGSIVTEHDSSYGIFAQSVGGGGGSGGLSVSGAIGAGNVGVSLGGSGGSGGAGGTVDVNNVVGIATGGVSSHGILAQSVGGGGGEGGMAVSASVSASASISVGLGGNGGSGANAARVRVDNQGNIFTGGTNAFGILAQSVGGGGGAGGNTITASAAGGIVAGSVAIGLGGSGGSGGTAGAVELDNTTADIRTLGVGATALVAQSIGGGGGAGGYAVAATLTISKDGGGSVSVALGGNGGSGGTGGTVDVDNTAKLDTTGDQASGIVAQSLGGGGGVGGTAVAGALNFSKGSGIAVAVALGGAGGNGGTASAVTVDNDGDIVTRGADAFVVLVQSIGGSGGAGGMSIAGALNGTGGAGGSVGVSLGGSGGNGAEAGTVTVTNSGDITTTGARSGGVVAQSIGGAGGAGGLSVGLALAGSTQAQTGAVAVSLGGTGGGGGTAKAVKITNTGNISTSGASNETAAGERVNTDAHALLVQSIGGSGGIGGIGGAAGVAIGKELAASASIAVGGIGGSGGIAGDVTVDNSGNLSTGSDNSMGIVAQSIGGGGGAGGGSVALSFAFSQASNSGAVGVSIGGGGGAGVEAGDVFVDSTGIITTSGASAHGILAQSIGGDGGQGGFSVSATGTVSREVSGAIGVAVGGPGGVGGKAGDVKVGSTQAIKGTIATTGDNAAAIVAQSIGGGGGAGGFAGSLTGVVNLGANKRTMALGVTVGGFGGSGGEAGVVEVITDSSALISTKGDFGYGILAQSIGGKGGTGGGAIGAVLNAATDGNSSVNAALTVGGFGGDGAVAGAVLVDNGATIITGDASQAHGGQFAHGILAQSIGGDGGAGGFSGSIAFAVGASNQSSNNYNLSASVGGFGGTGADAGTVTVDNSGMIVTLGERARGIFAQSVGGGGGAGGDTGLGDDVWGENFILDSAVSKIVSGDLDSLDLGAGGAYAGGYGANSHSLAVSVGGFGGAGGDGSAVNVDNDGAIWTFGKDGHAIFAQSVGGGGGSGGISTSASAAVAASNSTSLALAVGGFGGAGGDGGDVIVDNSGEIITVYHGAYGVFAQSVGGGGGAGGDTRGFTLQRKDTTIGKNLKPGKQITVTVGGFGGAGGDSGTVDVANSGDILTFGTGSIGIFAQTVGGGGGTGGNSSVSSAELAALFEDDEAYKKQFRTWKYKLALGGFGGAGGTGEAVTVDNSGTIVTLGEQSTAIYAQSVGGGGGTGGKGSSGFTGDFSIGGFGGTGSDGGLVAVSNTGAIATEGNLSDGIFAQSVGGGGGDGGAADFGNARSFRGELIKAIRRKGFKEGLKDLAKKTFLPTFGVGVGGFGGASGDGGTVFVCNGATYDAGTGMCTGSVATASIHTTGDASHGIFAQSVGGGGGTGGQAFLTNVGKIGIGGLGGAAGDGGKVTVVNNGDIVTEGNGSFGVFAQSVGGGGGLAGDITFGIQGLGRDEAKLVRQFGQYASGASVPGVDLDGDGTITTSEVTETQAMFGFGTGNDEKTDIDENGLPISDELASQFASLYDSAGGGGVADPLSYSPADPLNGQSTSGLDAAVTDALSLGLQAGADAMKSSVLGGLKSAFGNDPTFNALFDAMSGSEVIEFLKAAFTSDGTSITFKSSVIDLLNGVTGDGGAVSVTTNGNIIVTGGKSADELERAGSIGIFAQSVGGGGGIVGNTVEVTEAETDTDLNGDGDKSDTFDVSDGTAFAGTVGGHGKGGTVFVRHTGSIVSPSLNGIGIFAQSTGGDGGSDITVEVDGGIIEGGELLDDGTGVAAAIIIDGGANNRLTIGADSEIFARSERAIIGGEGDEAVASEGRIIGNIDLGRGTNGLTNKLGGFIETRTTINLNGGAFDNAGEMDMGGFEIVTTTALTGSYEQTTTGNFIGDFSFGVEPSDLLDVTGSANVGGILTPHLMRLAVLSPPETFIRAGGGATDDGISVQDTLTIDYGIVFTPTEVQLAINGIDFTPTGIDLTRNQASAGDFINTVLNGEGSEPLAPYFAYLANLQAGDEAILSDLLERVHAEPYAAMLAPVLFSAQRFGNALQSCPVDGDTGTVIAEGQCLWARVSGAYFGKDSTRDFSATDETSYAFSSGGQFYLAPHLHLGGAIEYEQTDFQYGRSLSSKGDRLNFGGVLKYQAGSTLLSAAAAGGYGWYDTTRIVDLGFIIPGANRAEADHDIAHAHFQLRAAQLFTAGSLYAKPILDLTATYLATRAFHEAGVGALNLQLADQGEWVYAASPSLELGAQLTNEHGVLFRPYIRGGVTRFSENTLGVNATFEGAPASAGTFGSVSDLDKTVANVTAGIDVLDPKDGFDLRFSYDGRFGEDNIEVHSGSARFILNY